MKTPLKTGMNALEKSTANFNSDLRLNRPASPRSVAIAVIIS